MQRKTRRVFREISAIASDPSFVVRGHPQGRTNALTPPHAARCWPIGRCQEISCLLAPTALNATDDEQNGMSKAKTPMSHT